MEALFLVVVTACAGAYLYFKFKKSGGCSNCGSGGCQLKKHK